MSPYLFLFCVEGLSAITRKFTHEGRLQGIKVCGRAPMVTNLFFADDSIHFFECKREEGEALRDILHIYALESGQQVSLQKCELSFSDNVEEDRRKEMGEILEMQIVDHHDKYLGLPTVIGRSKKAVFSQLVDRVRKKVKMW
ncbi:unnamed protein product [Linum trigynum]|uniref:Reverse transcriptase n=1 Tax=Linum trigynum TaxID=586398 RepID=A0AAV2GU03_9ROSI